MSLYVISENKRLINVENHLIFNREEQAPPLRTLTDVVFLLNKRLKSQTCIITNNVV